MKDIKVDVENGESGNIKLELSNNQQSMYVEFDPKTARQLAYKILSFIKGGNNLPIDLREHQ